MSFDVLNDPGNEAARQWGLVHAVEGELREVYSGFKLDLEMFNGDPSWTLPLPTRAVLDSSGTIRAIDTDPDYTKRPEPQATIDVLQSLG